MIISKEIIKRTDELDISAARKYLSSVNAILRSEKIYRILGEYPVDSFGLNQINEKIAVSEFDEFRRLFPESFIFQVSQYSNGGGDFFWYTLSDDIIYFVVADCTGHGVMGTFMSILGSAVLEQAVHKINLKFPADILNYTDRQLKNMLIKINQYKQEMWGMDLAMVKIDLNINQITYSGANRPLLVFNDDRLRVIQPTHRSLGFRYDTSHPFRCFSDRINTGTRIYLYTDGIVNQMGGPLDKKFKPIRLRQILTDTIHHSVICQKNIFKETFINWKGKHLLTDDALLFGMKL